MRAKTGIYIIAAVAVFSVAAAVVDTTTAAQRGVVTSPAGPVEVLIIRHGEEPKDGPHLDDRGKARAKALINIFKDPFGVPTSLYAAKSSKQSERSVETLEPLAKSLRLPIDTRFSDQQFKRLAESVLHGSRRAGGHVLICWHKETMTQLAEALGVKNAPVWPDNQYDHVWRIRYGKDKKAVMTDEPMGLSLGGPGK